MKTSTCFWILGGLIALYLAHNATAAPQPIYTAGYVPQHPSQIDPNVLLQAYGLL